MVVKGVIENVGTEIAINEKFRKREIVLTWKDDKGYEQHVQFVAQFGGVLKELDKMGNGQEVELEYVLQGRNWTNKDGEVKTFNTLLISNIKAVGSVSSASVPAGDDLPF